MFKSEPKIKVKTKSDMIESKSEFDKNIILKQHKSF